MSPTGIKRSSLVFENRRVISSNLLTSLFQFIGSHGESNGGGAEFGLFKERSFYEVRSITDGEDIDSPFSQGAYSDGDAFTIP
jgi:hypothetical protein